jgi:hypothetical protein
MEHVSDVGRVEFRFIPFGDSVSVRARWVHGLHETYHRHRKLFWTHSMGLLGDEAQVEAQFSLFGDSATLDARLVHGLRQIYCRQGNSIGGNRWNS